MDRDWNIATRAASRGIVLFELTRRDRTFGVERASVGDDNKLLTIANKWAADSEFNNNGRRIAASDMVRVMRDGVSAILKANDEGASGDGDRTQAQVAIDAATDAGIDLFHDGDDVAYVTLDRAGRRHTCRVESRDFRNWLARTCYERFGKPVSATAIADTISTLAGRAVYEGETRPVFVRIAALDDGRVILDLADDAGHYVEIDLNGWRIGRDDAPVRFIHPRGQRPLPVPCSGGSIGELRGLLNLTKVGNKPSVTDPDFVLIVAFVLVALRGDGPYPVLALKGEQGSAKSTAAKMIRELFDPAEPSLRAAPRSVQDLIIAAQNSHVVVLDNLSRVSEQLSDGLCRLATGGGFGARKLYTDDEEAVFDVMRPTLLNGINRLASRSDLADRTIEIALPPILDSERRRAASIDSAFADGHPRILAALLDAVSAGLRAGPVEIERPPRMADFAAWVVACESGLPWPNGLFMETYRDRIRESNQTVLDDNAVARAIMRLLEDGTDWDGGSLTDLLKALSDRTLEIERGGQWPKSGKGLGNVLERLSPNLRRAGIEITRGRGSAGHRRVRIKLRNNPSEASEASAARENRPDGGETEIPSDGSSDAATTTAGNPSDNPSADNGDSAPETGLLQESDGSDGFDGSKRSLESGIDRCDEFGRKAGAYSDREWLAHCTHQAAESESTDPDKAARWREMAEAIQAVTDGGEGAE